MSSIRLQEDLKERIRQAAAREGLSVSDIHRLALQEYLDCETNGAKTSRYSDVIGVGEGARDLSARSREVFAEILDGTQDRYPD